MGENGMKNGMHRKGENIGKSRVFGHTFQTFRKFQKKYIPLKTFAGLPFCKIFLRWVYVFVPECGIWECGGRKPLQHKEKWHSGNIPEGKNGDENRNEGKKDEKKAPAARHRCRGAGGADQPRREMACCPRSFRYADRVTKPVVRKTKISSSHWVTKMANITKKAFFQRLDVL